MMKFTSTELDGVFLISPAVHGDHRGFFLESYTSKEMEAHGLPTNFVQDNHARSLVKGVLRGMHFQKPPFAQSKFVRVTRGAVYDVVVDMRKESRTFGKWAGFTLTEENHDMLFVPQGFAHGYCTLTDDTEFLYKVDAYYAPAHDAGICWNDPDIAIKWPVESPVLSDKDNKLPLLKEIVSPY